MGTRVSLVFCFFGFLFVLGCKSKYESIYQSKEDFMYAYKSSVFYGCMNGATNDNFSKFSKNNNDLGLAPTVAVIYHAETQEATELGEIYSTKIKPSTYSDYQEKSPIFSSCAYYAFYSKEVDSIANTKYEEAKNAKMNYEYD